MGNGFEVLLVYEMLDDIVCHTFAAETQTQL